MPEDGGLRSDPLEAVPREILDDLRQRYSEPQRSYHTWRHIEELLALFADLRSEMRDAAAILFAILFHDAVYDPDRADNEDRSADLLCERGAGVLPPRSLAAAVRLIKATKSHRLPPDLPTEDSDDAGLFIDMDLAILGAPAAQFDEYERQIRAEYAQVPDEDFRAGRSKVLREFLARETLFLSEWGRKRFTEPARSNLRRALSALEPAGPRKQN